MGIRLELKPEDLGKRPKPLRRLPEKTRERLEQAGIRSVLEGRALNERMMWTRDETKEALAETPAAEEEKGE